MRTKQRFMDNWRFYEGDIESSQLPRPKGPLYRHAKAEVAQIGPGSRNYVDNNEWAPLNQCSNYLNWETVRLPHDYVVDKIPDKSINEGLGFLDGGNAWYRKTFKLDPADKGKRISIYFEGVTNCCTVYVNSCLAKRNFCGYVPFEVDITDYAYYGDEVNTIAVYIDNSSHEGWWYDGGGIYRNVWLIKTDMVSVDTWGVYVAPKKIDDTTWEVPIETTVRNDDFCNHRVAVKNEILDEAGNVVAETVSNVNVPLKYKAVLNQKVTVTNPALWSCEAPNLYYCRTTIYRGKTVVDESTVHFGFRTIRFDADKGFFLNDKHVIIKGVCCHEDYGLQGKAVYDRIKRYRIKLLKEMGANGYRTSHYSQSDQTLDELDRQGFLVMDETRWFGPSAEYMEQLETLVKKDRNRPSVIMWSIFNEERLSATELGKKFAEKMSAAVRRLDATRPVTSASDANPQTVKCFDAQDIIGINYNLQNYDALHEKFPNKPIFSSENCATGTTRGWYFDDNPARGYINNLDKDTNSWFRGREVTWKFIMEREWIAGGYQWAGIEHRGEAAWPRLCSQSGALDLYLQKKDAFYQNQSLWTDKPMVHIAGHWNLDGRDGEAVKVRAYTNCDEAELFFNGRSQGRVNVSKYSHADWMVEYQPGEIVVKGYIGGKEAAIDRIATTGKPVALKLEMQTEALFADKNDCAVIHCYCVDENGNKVPDAAPMVHFNCSAEGCIRGTGSDISDHTSMRNADRQMRAGVIAVLAVSNGTAGTLKVYAQSEGLKAARIEIDVTEPNGLIR